MVSDDENCRCVNILANYILLTPVKNEEVMLPKVAECIIGQTIRPVLWIIIDGNSSDQSLKIAKNLSEIHDWIKVKKQESFSSSGGHINFSLAMNEAYKFAADIAIRNGIQYSYLGKIDADQVLSVNFFEYLIQAINADKHVGVVSGKAYTYRGFGSINIDSIPDECLKEDKFPEDELPDKRLYRKEALEDIGGFPVTTYSPDTVTLAKLRLKGWKIKKIPEVKVINLRKDTGIERDWWRSSIQFGKARYYLGYHPFLLLMACIYILKNDGLSKALGVFFGYCIGCARRDEIISDSVIWNYFHYKRMKEMVKLYL